jgi:uncharacterized protein YcaQ
VLPAAVRDAPTPERAQAQRALLLIAAQAMGVATERDIRDYWRTGVDETARSAGRVGRGGRLVAGHGAWVGSSSLPAPAGARPRRLEVAALLSPFDNLIWFRERTERLFGVRVRLEIYTPADKRVHGYYVLPFLQGEPSPRAST